MQVNDPCYQVKQLVCQYLAVEDLTAARLSSRDWCRAASSSVTTACVSLSETYTRQTMRKNVRRMLQAFPCCTQIICQRPQRSASSRATVDDGPAWAQEPFLLLTAVGGACSTLESDAHQGHKEWDIIVKPHTADLSCPSSNHVLWVYFLSLGLRYSCNLQGLLFHRNEPLSKHQLSSWIGPSSGQSLIFLHSGLEYPVQTGHQGGFMGWGHTLDSLRELYLHSPGGKPIKLQPFDLQLPSLQHLQLSGNITLDMSWPGPPCSYGLQSSQLTSITLQQVLSVEDAATLHCTQPHLQHLAVLAPAPPSTTPWQDLKFVSSTRSIEVLRAFISRTLVDPDQQIALLGAHTLSEQDAKMVVDFALTPPGLQSPESLAAALLAKGAARHAAVKAADAPSATASEHAQCTALQVQPWDASAAVAVAEGQQQSVGAGAEAGAQDVSTRKVTNPLQHLAVQCGCWVDLQGLLQQWSPERLTVFTLPAVTDALQHGYPSCSALGRYWFQVAIAFFAGATPAALRMQLPAGLNLRVLDIYTTRTCAGIEIDDRALLTISSSCRQLQTLRIQALLKFGDKGGSALRSLQDLQQLQLWDLRWIHVYFLLQLAADAPGDDMRALRRMMSQYLQRIYFGVSIGGFAVAAALRRHRVLRAAALLGMAALALPATAACSSMLIPLQQWQAARLCAAAAGRASRPAFVVRPCWLPASLQHLQLHDCVLRCHKHCPACKTSCAQQHCNYLHVEVLPAQEDPPHSRRRRHLLLGGRQLASKSAVRQIIREGRRRRWLPSLRGLVGKVLLAPCVPFAVTLAGKVGLSWLLKNHGEQLQGLLVQLAGSRKHGPKGLSPEQLLAVAAAVRMGV